MSTAQLIENIKRKVPLYTPNPYSGTSITPPILITPKDIDEAEQRLQRFAPVLMTVFPELTATNGLIESPLIDATTLVEVYSPKPPGKLFIKADSELAVAGSIKARGGIYEVLKFAETIALETSLIKPGDHYQALCTPAAKKIFDQYRIMVGSTGNLGFSIGLMARALGFHAEIHMSAEAKEWKKNRLRDVGAGVIQHTGDYAVAVSEARYIASTDPKTYFVDDERSIELFMGYTTAAARLQKQFIEAGITVDAKHPLYVYLPCGVGGAPGGITYGLKQLFGEHVHCIFIQPVDCPCFLLRAIFPDKAAISVYDIGLSNMTEADGLAVPMASDLVFKMIINAVEGFSTVADEDLFFWLKQVYQHLNLRLEPSAAAGFVALQQVIVSNTIPDNVTPTHLMWTTGGSKVPDSEFQRWIG